MEADDPPSTRTRIVEAAIAQLADEGMRGLTHRRVSERAGTTLGLVRYHFGSLEGLITAVLDRMAELQRDNVMALSEELREGLAHDGPTSAALWREARAAVDRTNARPDLTRARFELLLHAARNRHLQGVIRESRNAFVDDTARLMDDGDPRIESARGSTVRNPEAAARMILAALDGLSLHQLSAHEASVDDMSPALLLATIGAAATLPASASAQPGRMHPEADD